MLDAIDRCAIGEGAREERPQELNIIGVHPREEALGVRLGCLRVQPEQRAQLVRPPGGAALQVQLPAAQLRGLLRVCEPPLAGAQRLLHVVLFRDVLQRAQQA